MADQASLLAHEKLTQTESRGFRDFKAWITFNLIIKVLSFNFTLINENTGEFSKLLSNAEGSRWLTSNGFMMAHDFDVWKLGFKRTTC